MTFCSLFFTDCLRMDAVREASPSLNGWIFGKVPNGFWPRPPPHFRKVTLRFSRQNCDKSAYVHMEEHLCILWSYFPWDACSTNVQHGNRVKTYPKRPFCITFMLKKPCLKVQILQYKFLDWKWPPPLSELFRKFIRSVNLTHPLPSLQLFLSWKIWTHIHLEQSLCQLSRNQKSFGLLAPVLEKESVCVKSEEEFRK